MRRLIVFILLVFGTAFAAAGKESIAVLETRLQTATGTDRVDTLTDLSFAYWNRQPQHGLELGTQALNMARSFGYSLGEARALNSIGVNYWGLGEFGTALDHYLRSLAISEQIDDKEAMNHTINNIGICYANLGGYEKALEYMLRSLRIQEELGEQEAIATSFVNVGGVYDALNDHVQALDFYDRSLKIRQEISDRRGIASSLINIATVQRKTGSFKECVVNASEGLGIARELGDKNMAAEALATLGDAHAELGDLDISVALKLESLAIREEIGDRRGIARSLISVGRSYAILRRHGEALQYLKRGLEIAESIDSVHELLFGYESLSDLFSETGSWQDSLRYLEEYVALNDRLVSQRTKDAMARMRIVYDMEKKEKELEIQRLHIERKERMEFTYIAMMSLGLLSILLLLARYRLKVKSNRQLAQQKEEIRHQAEELRKLSVVVSETDSGVVIMDAEARFLWVNEGFTRMHGYSLEQLIDERGADLLKASNAPDVRSTIDQCLSCRQSVIYETRSMTRNGADIWSQATLTPVLDEHGAIAQLILIDSDITRVKDSEAVISKQKDELQEINSRLLDTNRQLVELNEQQSEFLGIAAHDLRAPLATVTSTADLLMHFLNNDLKDRQKWTKFIGNIRSTGKHMGQLVDGLLNVSAIESGRLELKIEAVELGALFQACHGFYAQAAEAKGIDFEVTPTPDGLEIEADSTRIAQILDNLVGNALKFTETGGAVRVWCETSTSEVTVFVNDTGQGLESHELAEVFSGKKLSAAPTAGESSTGLGLVIVRKVLELHGRKPWVESEKGKGTKFGFSLPRVSSPP